MHRVVSYFMGGGWEVGGIKGEGKGAYGNGGTIILKKIGSIKCGGGL